MDEEFLRYLWIFMVFLVVFFIFLVVKVCIKRGRLLRLIYFKNFKVCLIIEYIILVIFLFIKTVVVFFVLWRVYIYINLIRD